MTLLLSRCESIVLHALGMKSLPAEVSVLECVNRAGSWLCAQPWKWTERIGTVPTVVSQAYVNCPADLRAVITAQTANYGLQTTGLDQINEFRRQSTSQSSPVLYSLVDTVSAAGVFTKRLELYPTPNAVETIGLFYRAGWQEPLAASGDAARIAVPLDWEPLYIEALIAYAMGTEERDVATVTARLDALRVSDMYQRLVRQDGMSQSNYGPSRGGAVAMQMNHLWRQEVPNVPAP